jgi:hypothetical protein
MEFNQNRETRPVSCKNLSPGKRYAYSERINTNEKQGQFFRSGDKAGATCHHGGMTDQEKAPVINIRYRELMKAQAAKGAFGPATLAVAVLVFSALVAIGWHFFRH